MESKGTTVVASCIHQALTDSHRYTTLTDATHVIGFLVLMFTATTDLLGCCVLYFHHHPDGLCCSVVPLLRARSLGSRAVRCNKPGLGSTTEQVNDFVDRPALNQHAYSGEEWHISATFKECDEGTTNRDLADLQ